MAKPVINNKAVKIWMIVTCILLVLLLVFNILASTVFYSLISTVMGRGDPIYADGIVSMFPATETSSKEEAYDMANQLNIELCREGFVLLKNKNNALPIATPKSESGATMPKVSVFGKNSVNLSYGGSGSGGFDSSDFVNLYDSLEAGGFEVNPILKDFYENESKSGPKRAANSDDLDSGGNQMIATAETPQSMYTADVKDSYGQYSDAAIVVITRIGGEGFDLPRYQGTTEGASAADDHYLQLDKNELELLQEVCNSGFERVIVLFNVPSTMEATFLSDPEYASFANEIDAALWIGFTGGQGILALGDILNGNVNPSGRTVDTWVADFTKDPTFVNFGTGPSPEYSDQYDFGLYYFVDYEESIYVGYRYYETRALTDGEEWYADSVVYPFGYGLSYTQFQWNLVNQPSAPEVLTKDSHVTVQVEVENTGDRAGKDVVQLYCALPYTENGIEKSAKVLVGFAKTKLLAPGEKETVEITFDPYDAASYDYRDANGNGFAGYELETGAYTLCVAKNAHETVDTYPCVVESEIHYDLDPVTLNTVENRYTGREGVLDSDWQLSELLSRNNWTQTWPVSPTAAERTGTAEIQTQLKDLNHNNPNDYYSMDYPDFDSAATMTLRDLLPTETPDSSYLPVVSYDDERWDALLDAASPNELIKLFNNAAYQTEAVPSIGLPATYDADGPSGFTCFMNRTDYYGTCNYCSEPVIAATWNLELVEEMGRALGEEGIWGNDNNGTPYSGIYAPGINIHRSPFGGRNSEYFSEDPFLSGVMAAAEIRGCQEKGVYCMMKHFVANEQETHRSINGNSSWLTEQALREIYLKPFEIAVKEGGARGVMTSFNRIGTKWTGGDYRLLTEILREEWGFRGAVICDFNTIPQYMNSRQMAYAGGDLNLATLPEEWCDPTDTADAIVLRNASKNIAYMIANSNAMNGDVIDYKTPIWVTAMYILDGVAVVVLGLWGLLVLRKAKRNNVK